MYVKERDGNLVIGSIATVSELVDDYTATSQLGWLDEDEQRALDHALTIMCLVSKQEWGNMS